MIEDTRTVKAKPAAYVVATDSYLSGWGRAPGRAIVALAVYSSQDEAEAEHALQGRHAMKRVRLVTRLKADGAPSIRVGEEDHLSIRDYKSAAALYPHRYTGSELSCEAVQGVITELHRVRSSRNGNPRYRAVLALASGDTLTVWTAPDSSTGYTIGNYKGRKVRADVEMNRGKPTINNIVVIK